jgi:iron complex outermembrane receptor protein
MNSHSKGHGLFCSAAPAVLAAALITSLPGSANAQTAIAPATPAGPAAADNSGQSVNSDATDMSEIVVTARKKSETLLEVPLAITAMSATAMEKKGVDDLLDVANYTPSLNITNFGNSSTNRGAQTVIVRGMVPGSTYLQTTTVFVNGAPLAASGIIDGISDVAQVEIIKGPQSAYFGRSTFGGAINIITKAPGDDFKVSMDATYGSYNWTDLKASVEGAIIPGVLSARITGRYYQTDGYYGSALTPGYKYGAQESKNIMGELKFTPIEGLTIRAFGAFVELDDGYQSFVKFPRSTFNCSPTPGNSIICGTLPMTSVNSPNPDPIPASFLDALNSPANAVRYKSLGLDHGGAKTQVRVGTLNISYDLPGTGVTLSSVTAANDYFGEVLTDNSAPGSAPAVRQPGIGGTYNGAFNQEFRATSDQDKRLRGSVGVNYSYLHRGGTGASVSAPGYIFTVSAGGPFNKHKTYGVFGSASLDVTDQLILNVEGRYQSTKTVGYVRTLVSGEPVETAVPGLVDTAKEFLPRVIVQYKFAPRHQLFATYAKGANPGIFNTAFVTYSPALQQYLTDLLGGGLVTESEHLTSYELGYKGELFDNRLQVDVGVYLSQWRDQVIVQGLRIVNPALTGIPGTLATNMYSNQGASDLKGVEANVYFRASPSLTFSGGASINDTKIIRYANTNSAQLLGYAPGTAPLDVFAGNQLAYGSKYSANVSLDYTRAITSSVDGYFHADAFYKSGQYGEPGNFYKTPDTKRVNLRVGAHYEASKFELFVENLFDNRAYLSASPAFDQTDGNRLIAAAVLPTPRRFGVRFHTDF